MARRTSPPQLKTHLSTVYSLIATANLNGLNTEAYLRHLFERLPEHPINRIDELLPWAIATELPQLKLAA